MKALILVDLQVDFMPGGSLPVPSGDEVIPVANKWAYHYARKGRVVVASSDWHPKYHVSFASTHRQPEFTLYKLPDGQEQMMWPDHCIANTAGAMLHRDLTLPDNVLFVRKGMDVDVDSYSAFANNNGVSTGLAAKLHSLGVDQVVVVGLALDHCVKATAIDSEAEGFNTFVLLDGCRAVGDAGVIQLALNEMAFHNISMLSNLEPESWR